MEYEYDGLRSRLSDVDVAKLTRLKNRIELQQRILQGLKEIMRRYWKSIFPVTLIITLLYGWLRASSYINTNIHRNEILLTFAYYALAILLSLFGAVSLAGLLKIIGTPRQAKRIELALVGMQTNFTDSLHCPLPISYRENRVTNEIEMVFHSQMATYTRWKAHQEEIAEALGVKLDENGIRKYKGKYKIILTGVDADYVDYTAPKAHHF